jgi:hypothetical protein
VGIGDIQVQRGSYVSNPPVKQAFTRALRPTLHILLFNSGRATGLVTGVRIHIDDYAFLDRCIPAQGDVPESTPYKATVPPFPSPQDATIVI